VDTRLQVVYNASHPNVLQAGGGRDWFFCTYNKDSTNLKTTDRLNRVSFLCEGGDGENRTIRDLGFKIQEFKIQELNEAFQVSGGRGRRPSARQWGDRRWRR
jgi:hypothetical protein